MVTLKNKEQGDNLRWQLSVTGVLAPPLRSKILKYTSFLTDTKTSQTAAEMWSVSRCKCVTAGTAVNFKRARWLLGGRGRRHWYGSNDADVRVPWQRGWLTAPGSSGTAGGRASCTDAPLQFVVSELDWRGGDVASTRLNPPTVEARGQTGQLALTLAIE